MIFGCCIIKRLMGNKENSKKFGLIFFLIFNSLFTSGRPMGWQGTGNMSAQNLTAIWSFINERIFYPNYANNDAGFNQFTTALSNQLNTLWEPAWNVFTLRTIASSDAVVYGYAFRNHWMWYNGFQYQGKMFSFIIWKDYNCKNWITVGETAAVSQFNSMESQDIFDVRVGLVSNSISDIWVVGKKFIDGLAQKSNLVQSAYSIVLSQDYSSTLFYGRVCAVGNKQQGGYIMLGFERAKYALFQTR